MVHSGRLDVLIPGFHWRGWIFPAGAGLLLSWVMLTRHSDTGHKLLCWTRRQSANSPLFSYYFKDPWLLRNDPGSFTQQLTLSRVTSLLPVRMQHWEGNWLNFFFLFSVFEAQKLVENAKPFEVSLWTCSDRASRHGGVFPWHPRGCLWKWVLFRAWALKKCQEANTDKTL